MCSGRLCLGGRLGTLDSFNDELPRLGGIAPADHLHPFSGFEVFVVHKEMLDLVKRDSRQVGVITDTLVALREFQ